MDKVRLIIWCLSVLSSMCACSSDTVWEQRSPSGDVVFSVRIADSDSIGQILSYDIKIGDSLIVEPSALGLVIEGHDYFSNAKCRDVSRKSINETYVLKSGKRLSVNNRCEEINLTFENPDGVQCVFQVRVADDGAAFRYGLVSGLSDSVVIDEELTEFSIHGDGKAWIHPYDWNDRLKPSYEQYSKNAIAINSPAPTDKGWAYPMLFEADGRWVMVTEAFLDGSYPATHVDNSGKGGVYKVRFPEMEEAVIPDDPRPCSAVPMFTPWRVVMVGRNLNQIFTSQMVQNLNLASSITDESWIKPGCAAWSWWYDGHSSSDYKAQLKYVDLCKEMGWDYLLVDAGWDKMDGEGIEGVTDYATKNGVGVWLWYHSGSGKGADSPVQHRLMSDSLLRRQEMERISRMGIKGVKVDFFDTDKQRVIALYPAILRDAAEYGLMVDFHGATLPRGFERTYPNMMTPEAIRGGETLGRQARCELAAEHNATVVFTRNVVGSMDYTPVTFSNKIRLGVEAIRRTSVAHQLALGVVFESGFQCFADRAEAYLALPDAPKNFLREIPSAWDESVLLAGYPSDYAVVARQKDGKWYIGGINGKNGSREISFELPAECVGKTFTLIKDGENINEFSYETVTAKDSKMKVRVIGNGGFAAAIQ